MIYATLNQTSLSWSWPPWTNPQTLFWAATHLFSHPFWTSTEVHQLPFPVVRCLSCPPLPRSWPQGTLELNCIKLFKSPCSQGFLGVSLSSPPMVHSSFSICLLYSTIPISLWIYDSLGRQFPDIFTSQILAMLAHSVLTLDATLYRPIWVLAASPTRHIGLIKKKKILNALLSPHSIYTVPWHDHTSNYKTIQAKLRKITTYPTYNQNYKPAAIRKIKIHLCDNMCKTLHLWYWDSPNAIFSKDLPPLL